MEDEPLDLSKPTPPSLQADLYRAVHRGLRQIVANELGANTGSIQAQFRKALDDRVQAAVTNWLDTRGLSTVEAAVERVLEIKLATFRSSSKNELTKIVQTEIKKQVAEQVTSLLKDNLHLHVSAEIGGPKKRALDLKE